MQQNSNSFPGSQVVLDSDCQASPAVLKFDSQNFFPSIVQW